MPPRNLKASVALAIKKYRMSRKLIVVGLFRNVHILSPELKERQKEDKERRI